MKPKGHLKRLSLLYTSDPLYFITTCVEDRSRSMLATDQVQSILVREWASVLSNYGWSVGSFVIMPDHVHFFCRSTPESVSLSKFIGKWKERASKGLKQIGYTPPVWQREFFDHILRSEENYSEKWNYVRENPVRAGLVRDALEWPYQGHVHFI